VKVKFCNNNNANIHSKVTEVFDTKKDFDLNDEEWKALSDEEKDTFLKEWAYENFDMWIEEDEE
jgi:hypothetical protein